MGKRYSKELVNEMISLYLSGYSTVEIGAQKNKHPGCVVQVLKRCGIPTRSRSERQRRYTINDSYFDNINTEMKAYFLGLLYADGTHNPDRYCIRLRLQEGDRHILDTFSSEIVSNRPLRFIPKKQVNHNNQYGLSINNKRISNNLLRFGLVKRKSWNLNFPYFLQKDLIRHFVRGFVDGDGTLYISKNKRFTVGISSTYAFTTQLESVIYHHLGIHGSISKSPIGTHSYLRYHGNINALIFCNWLYLDNVVSLNRKYDKFLKMKELRKEYVDRPTVAQKWLEGIF